MSLCKVEGCSNKHHSLGYCRKHAARFKRNGTVELIREQGGDTRRKHPLYTRWFTILELARSEGVAPEWAKENFKRFVADVGLPPSANHRLLKKDPHKLIGPMNFHWVEKLVVQLPGESQKDYRARQYKAYIVQNPYRYRRNTLKTKYGITPEEQDAMIEAQDGKCAVCQRRRKLVTDHDHLTGKVRQMLCYPCNTGLGNFSDQIEVVEAAVRYLRKHAQSA